MKILFQFIVYLIILISFCTAEAKPIVPGEWTKKDVVVYHGNTGKGVTSAWDDQPYDPSNTEDPGWCPLATFQLKIYNEERDYYIWINDNIPRTQFEYMYAFPKSGHWVSVIRVRQKCELPYRDPESANCQHPLGEDDKETGYEYSDWSYSTDPAVASVDGEPRGWKHFTWIPAPGPIEY